MAEAGMTVVKRSFWVQTGRAHGFALLKWPPVVT